ncbi:hypothetical protein [Janthinobacterium sp. JC611]|uniref:hypothetical protein n=1 Tax=Janthinobacterium sp. JC611 TaxID=2816201 RepID=UPI001BFD13C1|nr:hypothetical protein [Janthinobacterium sp. JC611]
MTQNDTHIETASGQIRAYLAIRPHGVDTPEGVAQWWLGGSFPPDVVEAALERLLASGEMERVNMGQRQLWRGVRAV